MKKLNLNGQWKLYFYNQLEKDIKKPSELLGERCIDATVPGNVELDLSSEGLLPKDLYFGSNMKECEKFETYAWWYEKEFELDGDTLSESLYLHFDGVDCLAEYFLNGEKIGESENMLTEHEFCIDKVKKEKSSPMISTESYTEFLPTERSAFFSRIFFYLTVWSGLLMKTNFITPIVIQKS